MKEQIEKATKIITETDITQDYSELTVCAVKIGELALTSLSGKLRSTALKVAEAICDYEDAWKKESNADSQD